MDGEIEMYSEAARRRKGYTGNPQYFDFLVVLIFWSKIVGTQHVDNADTFFCIHVHSF